MAITRYGRPFQVSSANLTIFYFIGSMQRTHVESYNPVTKTTAVYHVVTVWAVPLSLATTKGISVDFYSFSY